MVAEVANGAMQGGMAGAMTGNPYAAIGGAILGGVGGYLSGRSKKKAAKKRLRMMQEALNQYKAGSTDATGNTLSANKNGRWSYNLGLGGKQAAIAANRANILAGTTPLKSRSEIARDNFNANHLGNMLTARANQAAAMRSGLRTNSNLGNISQALALQNANNFTQNYANALQQAKNNTLYNANIASNLGSASVNASAPINNIQTGLQNMVNGLNANVMSQINNMAGVASDPYLHGQATADLFKGIGGMASAYAQNQQEQSNFDKMYQLLMNQNGINWNVDPNGVPLGNNARRIS